MPEDFQRHRKPMKSLSLQSKFFLPHIHLLAASDHCMTWNVTCMLSLISPGNLSWGEQLWNAVLIYLAVEIRTGWKLSDGKLFCEKILIHLNVSCPGSVSISEKFHLGKKNQTTLIRSKWKILILFFSLKLVISKCKTRDLKSEWNTSVMNYILFYRKLQNLVQANHRIIGS